MKSPTAILKNAEFHLLRDADLFLYNPRTWAEAQETLRRLRYEVKTVDVLAEKFCREVDHFTDEVLEVVDRWLLFEPEAEFERRTR